MEETAAAGGPQPRGGFPVWGAAWRDVEIRFVGRGAGGSREAILAAVEVDPPPVAWARQVHSSRVLAARPGACGEGDALVAAQPGLALSVATADCVPVLLAGGPGLAAIHAGWRGILAGVVPAAVAALPGVEPGGVVAWVGPAIGLCCYEVGEEVAAAVAAASAPTVVVRPDPGPPGRPGRPHLDLTAAVVVQLAAAGVEEIHRFAECTRCAVARLWSFRRDGERAGRNLAFIWRRGQARVPGERRGAAEPPPPPPTPAAGSLRR